jgi:hypothetical protein
MIRILILPKPRACLLGEGRHIHYMSEEDEGEKTAKK